MTDTPWTGDACSLMDAFRSGERSPAEELEAVYGAIDDSGLNAFCHLDPDRALELAKEADVSLPFGGLPFAIKELEPVIGWPFTEASLVFRDRVGSYETTMVQRIRQAGVVPVGATTASEFGGLNVSVTRINGVTHNPWRHGRTAGGSSGGSASAVAGGLVTLATGGDGGGSIRIPAAYNGLPGMKGTYGRIPRGPDTRIAPNTVVLGCLSRSIRDIARYYDVVTGYDPHDPTSLPRIDGWEENLGTHDLAGCKVIVDATLGGGPLARGVEDAIVEGAEKLIADLGMERVEADVKIPRLGGGWMMGNFTSLLADLEDQWPECAGDLTDELRVGLNLAEFLYDLYVASGGEAARTMANSAMAELLEQADFVICATNPDPAFPAESPMSDASGGTFIEFAKSSAAAGWVFRQALRAVKAAGAVRPSVPRDLMNWTQRRFANLLDMGALTIPANITGNPAISIPVDQVDGLPIGMQVIARHHEDARLLDVGLAVERERPWPVPVPGAPV